MFHQEEVSIIVNITFHGVSDHAFNATGLTPGRAEPVEWLGSAKLT